MPFDVPRTIDADTCIHVGVPKLRLPTSENACPFSFFSLVHRTTSHGGDGVSTSPESGTIWLLIEPWREWPRRKGDEARGIVSGELERRDWNRLSKGRKEGVGLSRPGLDATDGRTLLPPGEDRREP
jgi:hypothetical protein